MFSLRFILSSLLVGLAVARPGGYGGYDDDLYSRDLHVTHSYEAGRLRPEHSIKSMHDLVKSRPMPESITHAHIERVDKGPSGPLWVHYSNPKTGLNFHKYVVGTHFGRRSLDERDLHITHSADVARLRSQHQLDSMHALVKDRPMPASFTHAHIESVDNDAHRNLHVHYHNPATGASLRKIVAGTHFGRELDERDLHISHSADVARLRTQHQLDSMHALVKDRPMPASFTHAHIESVAKGPSGALNVHYHNPATGASLRKIVAGTHFGRRSLDERDLHISHSADVARLRTQHQLDSMHALVKDRPMPASFTHAHIESVAKGPSGALNVHYHNPATGASLRKIVAGTHFGRGLAYDYLSDGGKKIWHGH